MRNFNYQNGTELIFGKGTELIVGKHVRPYSNKILLHYGGGSIKSIGLYDKVIQSLNNEGIEVIELGGVKPNPRISLVRDGVKLCREHGINFILAVGGGSVIDSAKAIAGAVNYKGDPWDLFEGASINHECLKLGVLLTIPAAGSETSSGAVVTNEDGWLKRSFGHKTLRPVFSILNPELTMTLSPYQTACGVSDMLAHCMERYFNMEEHNELTDRLGEATMKTIINNGLKVVENPKNYDVRAEIMLAGMVAHNGSLSMGRGSEWVSHNIEHELSGINDIAHGAGLSIVFPAWMKLVYKNNTRLFAQFANRVFDVEIIEENIETTCLEGIKRLEDFYKKIGLPITLKEGNFTEKDFETIASKYSKDYEGRGETMKIGYKEVLEILELANN